MKGNTNVFIGIGFIAYGIFMWFEGYPREVVLYLVLGAAFILTRISAREDLTPGMRRFLKIASWAVIGFSLFWFFWLVRTDQWHYG